MKNTPYFKITQISERYGLTRQSVYKWIWQGKIRKARTHPVDGSRYWLESDLPPLPPKGDTLPEGQWE
jgi:predicted DNA-binding transcriptional regulator AlpA